MEGQAGGCISIARRLSASACMRETHLSCASALGPDLGCQHCRLAPHPFRPLSLSGADPLPMVQAYCKSSAHLLLCRLLSASLSMRFYPTIQAHLHRRLSTCFPTYHRCKFSTCVLCHLLDLCSLPSSGDPVIARCSCLILMPALSTALCGISLIPTDKPHSSC